MFTLIQLRCFVAIADERHFGRAAARLHITQPPLSRHLNMLEDELGVRLLHRNSHGVELTAAGSVFLHEARQLLRSAEASAASARLAATGQMGHLALGFTASAAYELLPALIRDFRTNYPHVGLSLAQLVTLAQIEQLGESKLDAGLVRPTTDLERFGAIRMDVDRLVAAVPASHPLARKQVLRIEDFHRQPYINHSPIDAKYFFDITTELFRSRGVEPITVQSLVQPHAMLSMVRAGLGLAIVPNLVRRHSIESHLVFLELDLASPPPPIELWLIWRKEHCSPALENFLHSVRATIGLDQDPADGHGQQTGARASA